MTTPRILLIQARDAADPMARHERECIERRIGSAKATMTLRNAVAHPASKDWLAGADAVIIGGSGNYSVHHPKSKPWVSKLRHVLEAALARDLPGFGICFGHQLVGHHFGATVHTHADRAEVGTIDVDLTEAGRSDPLFAGIDPTFPVHTGHSDHVDTVPEGLDLLATTPTLPTQAFRVRGSHFYTTQFHPDLTGMEAVARYMAVAKAKSEAMPHLSRFRPGADASASLLGRFVELVSD